MPYARVGIEIQVSLRRVSGKHGSFASPQTRIWSAIFAFCVHTHLRVQRGQFFFTEKFDKDHYHQK